MAIDRNKNQDGFSKFYVTIIRHCVMVTWHKNTLIGLFRLILEKKKNDLRNPGKLT
jgi:hypothetical protein